MAKSYTAKEMREAADSREEWGEKDEVNNMLRYSAEVVERCEKMIRPCRLEDAPCVPSDDGYCDSCDVPTQNTPFNYILRGDAEKGGAK